MEKEEKKPDSYSDKQWADFKIIRDNYIEVLKDEDEERINHLLHDHPDNIRPADDDNEECRIIAWFGCPLKMTASYYANNIVCDEEFPVYSAEELKALLDA